MLRESKSHFLMDLTLFERGISMSIKTNFFALNEKVVYPGHGVARINRIVEKIVAGSSTSFFELKFLNKEMTILVPTQNSSSVGIRSLSSLEYINTILATLAEQSKKNSFGATLSNWNKRNKDYKAKLVSGNLDEISKIYRDLSVMATYKDLSFGEKNLLQQTEALLAQEISLVQNIDEKNAIEQLRAVCTRPPVANLPVATTL